MINYKVQPGDMIGVLAVKYKTTIRTIMDDNPFIQKDQKLFPGWILKIFTPEENAKRHSETAYDQIERAHKTRDAMESTDYILSGERDPVYYKERLVLEGQLAFGKVLKETPLIELQANGYIKNVRILPIGEIVRIYEATTYNGGMYLINNYQWVTSDPLSILYDEIPQYNIDGRLDFRKGKNEQAFQVAAVDPKKYSNVGSGTKAVTNNLLLQPQSMIGSGKIKKHTNPDGISSIPHFERPSYRRPVLHMKNAAGEKENIELRVLGFQASYSNSVQPSATNAGWMVNIRGSGLPILSISGFLMETKAANEFNDFMKRYHKYLQATKSGDFYSMGVSTLFYKKTEYKGIITGFSYTDREEETLHRKYSMSMLVLKEKTLDQAGIRDIPRVVDRKGKSEKSFRTDIGSMLANPITGKYYTDFD